MYRICQNCFRASADCNEILFEIEAPTEDEPASEGEAPGGEEDDGYKYNDPEEGE